MRFNHIAMKLPQQSTAGIHQPKIHSCDKR